MMYTPYPTEILQLPERVVFVYEGGAHVWRNIWLDGRQPTYDPNPAHFRLLDPVSGKGSCSWSILWVLNDRTMAGRRRTRAW